MPERVTLTWEREPQRVPELHRTTWHTNQPIRRASRDVYVVLRADLEQGPVGWGLQLGSGNPIRDVSLCEALALAPSPPVDADTLPKPGMIDEMVDAHFDLIESASNWIRTQGLCATRATPRAKIDRATSLLRDIVRLRREAYDARGCGSAELERSIEARLEVMH